MSIKLIEDRINVIETLASDFIVRNKECPPSIYNFWIDSIQRKGLLFTLDIECECFGYDENDIIHDEWANRERKKIYIIVAYPHNVFVNLNEEWLNDPTEENYVNTSTHDSCWRTDGFSSINPFIWDMYERVYSKMPEDKRPNMINANFFIWSSTIRFMKAVEITCSKTDHREKISKIEKIHFTELFKGKHYE